MSYETKSYQQIRAEIPGSALQARMISKDYTLGSAQLGSVAPLIHRGTQIATRLIQTGSRAAVTATGTNLHFSPSFSGTPCVFLSPRGAAGTTLAAVNVSLMKNINRSGGTITLDRKGTLVVDYLAWDPAR